MYLILILSSFCRSSTRARDRAQMRPGYTPTVAFIDWTNKEVWTKLPPSAAASKESVAPSSSPPALLAAGAKGALPDYWAATFKASAARDGSSSSSDGGGSSYASNGGVIRASAGPAAGPAGLSSSVLSSRSYLPAATSGGGRTGPDITAMRGDWEDPDGDENDRDIDREDEDDREAYPYDQPTRSGFATLSSASLIDHDNSYGPQPPSGGAAGGGSVALVLQFAGLFVLLAAAGGAVLSFRRHGRIEKQLIAEDAQELIGALEAARAGAGLAALCSSRVRRGMEVVSAAEEDAEEDKEEEEGRGGSLSKIRTMLKHGAAVLAAQVEQVRGAVRRWTSMPEIVSASDEAAEEDAEQGRQGGGGSEEEGAREAPRRAHRGGRKKRGDEKKGSNEGGGEAAEGSEISFVGGYDFDGEKLSWEVEASRPRPSEHPEAYVIDEGEGEEEVC